jgi:hypothetical protein
MRVVRISRVSMMVWPLAACAAGAFLLLTVACSSSDDSNNATATAKPSSDSTSYATDTPSGPTDPASQLQSLTREWEGVTAKITYDYTTTNDGATNTSTLITYSRPPDSRTDFTDSDTGETTIFLTSGGKSYLCAQGRCATSPAGSLNPIATITQYSAPSAITARLAKLAGVNIDTSSQTIAGKDAACFSVEEKSAETKITWCFSDDGLLLLNTTEISSDKFELKATDVQTTVSDADLQPPYPVSDIPGAGQ